MKWRKKINEKLAPLDCLVKSFPATANHEVNFFSISDLQSPHHHKKKQNKKTNKTDMLQTQNSQNTPFSIHVVKELKYSHAWIVWRMAEFHNS